MSEQTKCPRCGFSAWAMFGDMPVFCVVCDSCKRHDEALALLDKNQRAAEAFAAVERYGIEITSDLAVHPKRCYLFRATATSMPWSRWYESPIDAVLALKKKLEGANE